MPKDCNQDITPIREWMAKEPHLPSDLDDAVLLKFLHSCYGSLERCKRCIERFCSTRALMTDVYISRDPLATNIQTAFSATVVSSYEFEGKEILIHKFDDPTLEKFVFYDLLKTLTLLADHWVQHHSFLAEGHYIIIDMVYYSLKMIPRLNVMFFRDFLLYLLEGMPVRVSKIFVINAPSFYDKMYALIKPVLPAEICEIIQFFPDHQSLHSIIDKKYLPLEYGGDAQSMYEQCPQWYKRIEEERKKYLNDNFWKADIKKKPKNSIMQNTMSGSFRTLSID